MKRYWKKLTAILLVLLMVLSGCGKGNDKKETGAEAETLPPLIQIENIDEYVKLGTYLGVEAEKASAELTDKEIEDAINEFLDNYKDYEQIKEGVVAEGDTVGIDYVGKLDGVAFEGGTGSYDLKIGSNSFIDGFEDGLIGAKIGETVDLNLTFPKDYKAEDLAGKAVVFTVTVKYKLGTEKVRPEMNDDFAKEVGYKTAEALREALVKHLKQQKETEVERDFMIDLWDKIIADCEIKKHEGIYDEYYGSFMDPYEAEAEYYEMTLEKYVEKYFGMKYDEFLKYAEDYALYCMEQELVCRAIVKNEKITMSDEDYAKILDEYYKQNSSIFKDAAELEAYYGKDRLSNDVLIRKAMDLVVEKAVTVPKAETEGATEEATKSGN